MQTYFKETYPNRPGKSDSLIKRHQKVLVLQQKKSNKMGEACSYHYEPFKTAVAAKEIISLKKKIGNKFPQKINEYYFK